MCSRTLVLGFNLSTLVMQYPKDHLQALAKIYDVKNEGIIWQYVYLIESELQYIFGILKRQALETFAI